MCQTLSLETARIASPTREPSPRDAVSNAVITLDEFIESLIRVRLLDRAEVESFCERLSAEIQERSAEFLARQLVRTRKLTEYQAGALLQGKSRGLAIGNYLVLDKVGQGGMGMVFKAQHRLLKMIVALKVLPPSSAAQDAAVHRFRREMEAVARLDHRNIVAAFDGGEFNGLHYYVMELVDGTDLSSLVKANGPMSVAQALECLTQAAHGLKAAHEKGIYHRDIKPSNLMLDSSGTLKVLDLGLARMVSEIDLQITGTYALLGTSAFMSPEQAYDPRQADHRSDIYSLGCTLFFLLAGKPPYSGETPVAFLLAHREQPIPKLRDVRSDVSPLLEYTLERMLAKLPENRQQSIDALLHEIEKCLTPVSELQGIDTLLDNLETSRATVSQFRPIDALLDDFETSHAQAPERQSIEPTLTDRPSTPRARHRPSATLRWATAGIASVALATLLAWTVVSLVRSRLLRDLVEIRSQQPPSVLAKNSNLLPPVVDTEKKSVAEPTPEPPGLDREFKGHGQFRVVSVCLSPDGARVLSAGEDGKVRYWDVATDLEIGRPLVHDTPVLSVTFSSDGLRALTGSRDGTIRLWDLKTRKSGLLNGHRREVNSVAFSPRGDRALSGSGDKTVRLWDLATLKEVDHREHDGAVTAVAFSPNGGYALSGSEDKTVRLWNLADPYGKAIQRFEGPVAIECVAYSPRGDLALSGGPGGPLALWDLAGGAQRTIASLEVPGWVRCATFLPNGRHAVAGTQKGKLIVWDLEENREVLPRLVGPAAHLGVASAPDGVHVLTSDADGFVRHWRLPPLAKTTMPDTTVPGPPDP